MGDEREELIKELRSQKYEEGWSTLAIINLLLLICRGLAFMLEKKD